MRSWSIHRLKSSALTFAVLAVVFTTTAIIAEFFLSRSQERVAMEFMLIASIVIGIQVYVGNSGVLSFGHVAFFALAAYAAALAVLPPTQKESQTPAIPSWLIEMQTSLFGAVAFAVIVVLLFAGFTGVPVARMNSSVVPMATLAILVVVHSVANVSTDWTRGPMGLVGIPDLVSTWTILGTSLFVCAAALLYRVSAWGLKLQAIREDEVAAAALGIPVARMKFIGWVISAALVGVAGSVWGLNSLAFNSDKFFFAETFALLTMIVIGGLGSTTGAVLGAAIVSVLTELLRGIEAGFTIGPLQVPDLPGIVQLATAALMLLVLYVRPQGIFGNVEIGDLKWGRK